MAYEIPGQVISLQSGSTTLTQYKICRVSAANTVVHTTGLSTGNSRVVSVGVLQSVPGASTASTGRACSVMIAGVTKVLASSRAIAAGDLVRATSGAAGTSGGRARASSNSTPATVGIALTSCAASTATRYITMRIAISK
jgi:hypothetical protein